MGDLGCPAAPFDHLHVDFTGPLDDSHRMLVVVDRLTSYATLCPVPIA